MADSTTDLYTRLLRELTKIDYVKPGEFPNIDLYMDQVTTFMNTHLSDSKIKSDDKILTKTMINNYAKNNLLPPPVKKKYSKEHMIVLIFIYYFKNILSISEIQAMLEHFNDVKNKQDREFLQKFSMICMLGFDVFLKKQIIEGLIDTIVSDKEKSEHKEAERKAKKEPVKAPAKVPASKETHKK